MLENTNSTLTLNSLNLHSLQFNTKISMAMQCSEITSNTAMTSSPPSSHSFSSSSSPPPLFPPSVVLSPCAACKILRRRCAEKCVLAPYFPPTEPHKFTIAHRVFGASNIIKFLQELPESQRADAVSSMVYEAGARIRDPIYGCAGAICHLQRQVSELQAELAKAQAEIITMQSQKDNLLALFCMETRQSPESSPEQSYCDGLINTPYGYDQFLYEDDNNQEGSMWEIEALWT